MRYIEGASYLFSYFDCANLIFLSNPALSPYAKIACSKAGDNGVKVQVISNQTRKSGRKNMLNDSSVAIRLSEEEIITFYQFRNGNRAFRLESEDGKTINIEVENHLKLKLTEIVH